MIWQLLQKIAIDFCIQFVFRESLSEKTNYDLPNLWAGIRLWCSRKKDSGTGHSERYRNLYNRVCLRSGRHLLLKNRQGEQDNNLCLWRSEMAFCCHRSHCRLFTGCM